MGVAKFFRNLSYDFKRNRALLVMILPVVVYLIIFSYVPMAGAVIAFKSYNFNDGIFGSPWCGLNNFRFFFMFFFSYRFHGSYHNFLFRHRKFVIGFFLHITAFDPFNFSL